VVLSAVPIALATNVLRITATGVLHETVGAELANAVFHDLAGWLMMPVALVLLGVELEVLKRLFLERPAAPAPSAKVTFARITLDAAPKRRPLGAKPAVAPARPSKQEACDETA